MRGLLARRPAPLFSRPGGGSGGAYIGSIHTEQIPVDVAFLVEPDLQVFEHPVDHAFSAPGIEMMVDRLPGTVALRQITPGSAAAQDPEERVQDFPRGLARPAAPTLACGKQVIDQVPLLVRELVAMHL